MKKRALAFLALASVLGVASAAQASITVATFADPSNDAAHPLLTVTSTTISGGWTGSNLNLRVANDATGTSYTTYSGVSFVIESATGGPTVTRSGSTIGAGDARFFTGTNANLLTIAWGSGTVVEPFLVGGSYLNADGVTFAGSSVAGLGAMSQQQFAFSFANPAPTPLGSTTYTASMTSSATVVPEPASFIALGAAGALALARRKRS